MTTVREIRRCFAASMAAVLLVGAVAACGDSDDSSGGSASTGGSAGAKPSAAPNVPFIGELEEAGAATSYPEPKKEALTIGFASPISASPPVDVYGRAMKLEAERLGGQVINLDANANPDLQVSNMRQLIERKVDAIIVYPLDPNAIGPVVKQANQAGIPVVAIEANPTSTDPGQGIATQVLQNRQYVGYLQAQEAARLLPAGAQVGFIGFAVRVASLEVGVSAAQSWAGKFGLSPIKTIAKAEANDISGGEQPATQILAESPDVKGIISYNEDTAVGASAVARQQGINDMVLIGVNGSTLGFDAVRDGRLAATVQIDAPELGRSTLRAAYDLVQGVDVPKTVLTKPQLVSKDNIDQAKPWDDTLREWYGKTG